MLRMILPINTDKTTNNEKLQIFNKAFLALLQHFSDRKFDKTIPPTLEDVSQMPLPFWSTSPRRGPYEKGPSGVNIAFCPPNTYGENQEYLLHVRVYDPNEAHGVVKLLEELGHSTLVYDNDPWSKVDIEVYL